MSQRCQKKRCTPIEIERQLKLKYQNFFLILTIMSGSLYKPYYFPAISEYIYIPFSLFWLTFIKCSVMYQCWLGFYSDYMGISPNVTRSHAECFLIWDRSSFILLLSSGVFITSLCNQSAYLLVNLLSPSNFLLLIC